MRGISKVLLLISSQQKINKWTSNKKRIYSPGYNLLFDRTAIPSETFYVLIGEINLLFDITAIPSEAFYVLIGELSAAHHTGSFFSTVYHFKVCHS